MEPSGTTTVHQPTASLGSTVEELDTAVAEREADLSKLKAQVRLLPLIGFGLLVLLAIVATSIGFKRPRGIGLSEMAEWILNITQSPSMAIAFAVVVALLFVAQVWTGGRRASLESEIELLQAKRRIAVRLPLDEPAAQPRETRVPRSYFDSLVEINVDNLAEYYSLVKVHTNNSFRASLLAGSLGFTLIVVGVLAGFGGTQTATPATIAAASGVITEFIAGVFFYLYNRTVRQLKEYHDSLLAVQNVLLSFKLVADTEDPKAKLEMTAEMSKFLLAGSTLSGSRKIGTTVNQPRRRTKTRSVTSIAAGDTKQHVDSDATS